MIIKLLTRYARVSVKPEMVQQILDHLSSMPSPIALLEASNLIEPDHPDQGVAALLYLAFHHRIGLPLEIAPISGATLIEITQR